MARALVERGELIQTRAIALVDQTLGARDAWIRALGAPPRDSSAAAAWRRHASTVAAFCDRYCIAGSTPFGASPLTRAQEVDAVRARAAVEALRRLAKSGFETLRAPSPTIAAHLPSVGRQV